MGLLEWGGVTSCSLMGVTTFGFGLPFPLDCARVCGVRRDVIVEFLLVFFEPGLVFDPGLAVWVVSVPYDEAGVGRAFCVLDNFGPAGLSKKLFVEPVDVLSHGITKVVDISTGEFDSSDRKLAPAEALYKGFAKGRIGARLSVVDVEGGLRNALVGSVDEEGDAVLDRSDLVVSVPCFLWCNPYASAT